VSDQYAETREGVCGFCHPPPEDSPDREQLDRFADFLRLLADAPRDDQGRYIISEQAMRYAKGEDVAPIDGESAG
jgi:hypothetical protein